MSGLIRAGLGGSALILAFASCAGTATPGDTPPRDETAAAAVDSRAAPDERAALVGERRGTSDDELTRARIDRTEAPASAARACPAASDVRFARWASPSDLVLGAGPSGVPATGAWLVPIGFRRVDEGAPPPGPLDAARVRELGLEPLPPTLFVLRPGAAACPTEVTGYVADLIEDGVPNVRISAITSGCAPEDARAERGWVALDDPAGCTLAPAVERGRLALVEDDDGTHLPAELVPVPAPYAAVLRPLPCEAPCGMLWRLWVADGATDLAELWVDAITPGAADAPCDWVDIEGYSALFVVLGDGMARELPYPEVEGHRAPMTLAGTLGDASGTRVVLLGDHARWGAYELDERGTFGAGSTVDEYFPSEEDGIFRSSAPYCGP